MTLLYEMFSKMPETLTLLKTHLSQYIVEEGEKLVKDDKLKHDEFVQKLIDLRDKMISIYMKSF